MRHRRLSTTLAILAATGAAAFASSAQAAVVDNDSASMTGNPEVNLSDANVAFDFTGGLMIPRLEATLEADQLDDACVRVRIDSYDGATFLHSKPGITHCLTDDNHHEWSVNLNEDGDALTDNVVVKLEKENTQGWSTADQRTITMNTFADTATLSGAGIDGGGPGFAGGLPTTGLTLGWTLSQGQVTTDYDGYVHFDGFSRCGRIRLRYLDEAGVQLSATPGPQHCPPDLAYYRYRDQIVSAPSPDVSKVQLQLQSKSGGTWNTVTSQTVSIAE